MFDLVRIVFYTLYRVSCFLLYILFLCFTELSVLYARLIATSVFLLFISHYVLQLINKMISFSNLLYYINSPFIFSKCIYIHIKPHNYTLHQIVHCGFIAKYIINR